MMWAGAEDRDAEQDRRLANAEAAIELTSRNATEILKAIAVLQSDVKYLSRSLEQQIPSHNSLKRPVMPTPSPMHQTPADL